MSDEQKETKAEAEAKKDAGVASDKQNAKLEHSESGATTRDGTDAGVPMLPGDASEPVGPEDAFGEGPKRGDYSERVDGSHMESRPVEGGGEPILDEDGNTVDYKPKSELVPQTPRASDQGEVPGEKGGVPSTA